MWYTNSDDIPTASAVSRTFGRRISMTILCTFAINSVVLALFGHLLRRLHQSFPDQIQTCWSTWQQLNMKEQSPSGVFWKSAWISFAFIPFFMKYLITARISVFSIFSVHGNNKKESPLPLFCSFTCSLIKGAWLLHGNLIALALTFRGDSENFSTHTLNIIIQNVIFSCA